MIVWDSLNNQVRSARALSSLIPRGKIGIEGRGQSRKYHSSPVYPPQFFPSGHLATLSETLR